MPTNRPTEAEVRGLMETVRMCNTCALERFGQARRDDDGLWRDECHGCGELQFLGTYTEKQEPPGACVPVTLKVEEQHGDCLD